MTHTKINRHREEERSDDVAIHLLKGQIGSMVESVGDGLPRSLRSLAMTEMGSFMRSLVSVCLDRYRANFLRFKAHYFVFKA